MDPRFFEQPILNWPYEYPPRHWELDASGQPTTKILNRRHEVGFITPIPKPKKRRGGQREIVFDEAAQALETEAQQYDLTAFIGGVRQRVDRWREAPDPGSWQVTPETARLLKHWRSHRFGDIRPFFCQAEAVETAIWLTEVVRQRGREERQVPDRLDQASQEANPGLARLVLKLATGARKTTVTARIIAWQTIKRGAPARQPDVSGNRNHDVSRERRDARAGAACQATSKTDPRGGATLPLRTPGGAWPCRASGRAASAR